MGLISYIFGSDNQRSVKRLERQAKKILVLEEKYKAMSDDELTATTGVLKERLKAGETLNDILPDAYALVREASTRVLHMRHYPVQLVGGIALHQGRIAEMKTGEGKTLVETLPAYLNALSEKGVHIVTVNEYLAKRDAEWMGKVFKFLGLTVGLTLSGMRDQGKREAYLCDVTYGTNSEFGFDYLRDNMAVRIEQRVQRKHNFAIIDEVDSVLIDEARTPLIISGGRGSKASDLYMDAFKFAKGLKVDLDVEVDEEKKQLRLTDDGITKAEKNFKVENLSDPDNLELNHYINNALKAKFLMKRDSNYIVNNGQVLIVDEFTGRVMQGRRFGNGLHQAIEAKEGIEVRNENRTMATVTYQNYFRKYKKLSGMTGTAKTEETEFNKIYNLDVVEIPTNKPIARKDRNDIVYKTVRAKKKAIIEEIKTRYETKQPILVGTTTVDRSEEISKALKAAKIKHVVLNAKNHEKESEIVAQAGKLGAITIATNMAGRGTDIMLGGNPEFLAKQKMQKEGFTPLQILEANSFANTEDEEILKARKRFNDLYEEFKVETDKEKSQVLDAGGLFIIGTERHESRRIDNQLRGRSGRQGDPGESVFFISLEDDLARLFGGERLKAVASFFNLDDDMPLTNMKLMSRQIELAQRRVEGMNFSRRKSVLEFDNVLARQREIVYDQRDRVLEGHDVHEEVVTMINELVANTVMTYISDVKMYYEWKLSELNKGLEDFILPKDTNFITEDNVEGLNTAGVVELVLEEVLAKYIHKVEEIKKLGIDFSDIERTVLLKNVDMLWVEHIDNMTILRNEIVTRTDPINTYKREGFEMFDTMIEKIRENSAKLLLTSRIQLTGLRRERPDTVAGPVRVKRQKTVVKTEKKVGRNDPCHCGSGKKFKNCHGK